MLLCLRPKRNLIGSVQPCLTELNFTESNTTCLANWHIQHPLIKYLYFFLSHMFWRYSLASIIFRVDQERRKDGLSFSLYSFSSHQPYLKVLKVQKVSYLGGWVPISLESFHKNNVLFLSFWGHKYNGAP
jgi:hypothetical protein